MWIVKCKKIGINLIEYMFGVIISFLMYNFFVSLGMLEFLNVDIIPFISIQQIVKETIGVGVNEKAVLRFYKTALSFTSISIFPW